MARRREARAREQALLAGLGLNGLVFGHDPDALGFAGRIPIEPDGSLIKLDTGLETMRSHGMLSVAKSRVSSTGRAWP